MWRCLILLLLTATLAAQTADGHLDFVTKALPTASAGNLYNAAIKLQNGRGPFEWTITKGKLPVGIVLQGNTGVLSGVPTTTGIYQFTLNVRDLATNTVVRHDFTIEVQGPLLLVWASPPRLTENAISGSIKVTNGSTHGDNFDLTVVVVAVNEIGKAFTLGYQHFSLSQDVDQVVPFTSTVPNGQYFVRVDAVAEVAARKFIYRANLQTPPAMVVNVNR